VKEWLKSVLNYRSYSKNKTGYPFSDHPVRNFAIFSCFILHWGYFRCSSCELPLFTIITILRNATSVCSLMATFGKQSLRISPLFYRNTHVAYYFINVSFSGDNNLSFFAIFLYSVKQPWRSAKSHSDGESLVVKDIEFWHPITGVLGHCSGW